MPSKKTPKKSAKKSATKKKAAGKAAKKAVSKKAAKKTVKKAAKKAVAKKAAKKAVKKAPKKKSAKKAVSKKASNPSKKTSNSPKKAKVSKSAGGFSLEDALSVAHKRKSDSSELSEKQAARERAKKAIEEAEKKSENRVLGAASLADILGYNPGGATDAPKHNRPVPKKYEKFYNLLMELRSHVATGLNHHTEETLKRSSKDDAGDLSGYSQHMADAGTDTFDRDFALSMVSNEQEALHEIDEAIDRIFKGTYGICEMTGKQIREERLLAVPFTRYSIASQAQLERNKHRSVQRGGAFAEASGDDSLSFGDENPDA